VRAVSGRGAIHLGLLIVLALVHGPSLARHALRAADPLTFNDDVRQQVVPFFTGAGGMPRDAAADYYLACLPVGYRALYRGAAAVLDPATLSKALPYALLLVVLGAVAVAGHRLGGGVGAVFAAALVLSTDGFLERMVGGLPRAFASPLLAVAAAALVAGRAWPLAWVVAAATAFYPPAGLVAGLALAAVLFAVPARDRGDAADWSARRRLLLLGSAGAVALLVHLPSASGCARHGPLIAQDDAGAYPEAGPGGRYAPADRPPFAPFATQAWVAAQRALGGGERWIGGAAAVPRESRDDPVPVIRGVLVLLLLATLGLAITSAGARRLLGLGAAAVAAHGAARIAAPWLFLPERYVAYPVPLLVVILLPAAAVLAGTLADRLVAAGGGGRSLAQPIGAVLCVAVLGLAGGRVSADAGWGVRVSPDTRLYQAAAALPPDAVVAGWPAGPVENIPYLARRRALLTFETHQALHAGYLHEMRRRARALFEAYFASTWAPVLRLRDEFGVTHLLVDRGHFAAAPPAYFAPYDAWIAEAWARGRREGFVLAEAARAPAARFSERSLTLLDLRAVRGSPSP
jgi:hypothetical protein